MGIGDIVLVTTEPPHIASVVSEEQVVCEDGTHLPLNPSVMVLVCKAIDVVKELEKGVLGYNETWRFRDCE